MHHAFFYAGDGEKGIDAGLAYARDALGMPLAANPDVSIERHGLFSIEDARRIAAKAALAPARGTQKMIIIAAGRIFHEAQNALLKLFEEPPEHTTLLLIVPSEGDLLSTLRSRLQPLPQNDKGAISEEAEAFAKGNEAARGKMVANILDEAKSDKEEEKQQARLAALRLAEGLARAGYEAWRASGSAEMEAFLRDLDRLIPILHDRAAPLKPILEHILIIAPTRI